MALVADEAVSRHPPWPPARVLGCPRSLVGGVRGGGEEWRVLR